MLAQLQDRPNLISATLKYEHRLRDEFEQVKAVVQLVDGTYLHLNEVWINGMLRKYAYYQLTPTNEVIRGWDNAPHHPEVSTHPHHFHYTGDIHPSMIRSLNDLLEMLSGELSDEEFSGQ